MSVKKVIIVGSGVAGPATALALKKAGIKSEIYEAYPGPGDAVGAFMGITPNGQDVLQTLGVHEAVLADGYQTDGFHFTNSSDKSFGVVPADTITIKRGLLTKSLREAAIAAGIPFHWGKRLKTARIVGEGVIAEFEDGSQIEGDLLLACDGIHSAVRQAFFPDALPPKFTGLISCSSYAKVDLPPTNNLAEMVFGQKAFFSYIIKPSGETFWFANFDIKKDPGRNGLRDKNNEWWHKTVEQLFDKDQPFIKQIIQSSYEPIVGYPIYDLATLKKWNYGPVCLLGDAAHAPSPSAGQGGSLALEDAVMVAKCLRDIDNPADALQKFFTLRRERAERAVLQSRRNGSRKTPRNAFGRMIRDMLLPIFLKQGGDATKWMYDYHIEWDDKIQQ